MLKSAVWLPCALIVFAGVFGASSAEAKVVVYHTGINAWPAGPIEAPEGLELPPGFEAGYACETFGLFWADIATWDCQPALVSAAEESYLTLEEAPELAKRIEEKYSVGDCKKGFWEAYGRWLMLLGILGLIAAKVMGGRDEEAAAPAEA